MKKIAFSVSMFLILFGFTVSAETTKTSGDIVTLTPNISEKSVNDINNIGMKFCNDGLVSDKLTNQLQMQLQPGKTQEICTLFYSKFTDRTINVTVGFTEGTKRSDGTASCNQNTNDNPFAHMIQNNIKDYSFVLSGNEQSVKKFKMVIPRTATGDIFGCISYVLPDNFNKSTGDIFGIVIRKVSPIEIIITGDVYKLGLRDDMKGVYSTNKAGFLKIIIGILALWLIVTIFKTTQTAKKKETHHTKENHHTKK